MNTICTSTAIISKKMDSKTKNQRIAFTFAGILILIAAVTGLVKTLSDRHLASLCTEQTQGQVISVTEKLHTRRRGKSYFSYPTEYEFYVGSAKYTGTVDVREAQRVEQGETITVYYDPVDPANNTTDLAKRIGSGQLVYMVICIFFGTGMVIFVNRKALFRKHRNFTDK